MSTIYDCETQISNLNSSLERLVDYIEQATGATEIHIVEKEILNQVLQIGLTSLKLFIGKSGTGYQSGTALLSEDGVSLRFKGHYDANYLSIFGAIKVNRAGYYDKHRKKYSYPLDEQLNLPEDKYSYLLTDWMLSRATETNYRESIELFDDIFGLNLNQVVPQRLCESVSESVDAFYSEADAPGPETEGKYICASADGKGVRIHQSERQGEAYKPETPKARRAKGEKPGIKKEATVTTAYSFNPGARAPEDIVKALLKEYSPEEVKQARAEQRKAKQDEIPLPRFALNKHQRATMHGKDEAMDLLMDHITKRNPEADQKLVILLDGALSLENAFNRAIKKYGFTNNVDAMILDIIHVCEYVWEAGTAIFGEKSKERLPWVRTKLLAILNGQTGYVIGALKQVINKRNLSKAKKGTLQKAITYFSNHKHMMTYDKYLAKGFPIGTGVVEAACGTLVKKRMEGNGMRWKIKGAQAMLNQRAVKLNHDWKPFMKMYIESEKIRLYADDYKLSRKKTA